MSAEQDRVGQPAAASPSGPAASGPSAPGSPATANRASGQTRDYRTEHIAVHWDAGRCIHSHNCVRGLPKVFDPRRRPWVDLGAAGPDDIARTILRCPSGALHFTRLDGGAQEAADVPTTITPILHGPYYLRGDLTVDLGGDLPPRRDTRIALCRCTETTHAPFCDNTCGVKRSRGEERPG
jgi:uncharacterized Fe-S cluster protein YjdI